VQPDQEFRNPPSAWKCPWLCGIVRAPTEMISTPVSAILRMVSRHRPKLQRVPSGDHVTAFSWSVSMLSSMIMSAPASVPPDLRRSRFNSIFMVWDIFLRPLDCQISSRGGYVVFDQTRQSPVRWFILPPMRTAYFQLPQSVYFVVSTTLAFVPLLPRQIVPSWVIPLMCCSIQGDTFTLQQEDVCP
jgi:hypothetical protein